LITHRPQLLYFHQLRKTTPGGVVITVANRQDSPSDRCAKTVQPAALKSAALHLNLLRRLREVDGPAYAKASAGYVAAAKSRPEGRPLQLQ